MRPSRALACTALTFLAACAGTSQTVPEVQGTGAAGRQVYLTCASGCHAPEPILKYPQAKWPGIIAEMSEEAELSETETQQLRDYIAAVFAVTRR